MPAPLLREHDLRTRIRLAPEDDYSGPGFGMTRAEFNEDLETAAPVDEARLVLAPETAQGLLEAAEARVQLIQRIIADVESALGQFRQRREELAGALREMLAQNASVRRVDFDRLLGAVLEHHASREEEARGMLTAFHAEEEAVAERLKLVLLRPGGIRLTDFKRMLQEIQQAQQRRVGALNQTMEGQLQRIQTEVGQMLASFKAAEREKLAAVSGALRETLPSSGSEAPASAPPDLGRGAVSGIGKAL